MHLLSAVRYLRPSPAKIILGLACVLFFSIRPSCADENEQPHVGVQPDGRIVVPTNQVLEPAGTQVTFPGRPVDLALSDDGKLLIVKNIKGLVLVDPVTA